MDLERLQRGKRESVAVKLPMDIEAIIVPLSRSETQLCVAGAIKRFNEIGIPHESLHYRDEFQNECLNQLLHYALRNPQRPDEHIARDPDDLREFLRPDEQIDLYDVYERHFADVDPDPEHMSELEIREIEEAVKKKDAATLRQFGSIGLASYLLIMAQRRAT